MYFVISSIRVVTCVGHVLTVFFDVSVSCKRNTEAEFAVAELWMSTLTAA